MEVIRNKLRRLPPVPDTNTGRPGRSDMEEARHDTRRHSPLVSHLDGAEEDER